MTAAAYARYSTPNQQETSIMAQLDGIRAYCDREGITLYHTPYIDETRSGTNTDHPDFQRLLTDARAGLFDAVVVYDISRGSHDVADWFAIRRKKALRDVPTHPEGPRRRHYQYPSAVIIPRPREKGQYHDLSEMPS